MFRNIGVKIKRMALFFFILGVVLSVCGGLVLAIVLSVNSEEDLIPVWWLLVFPATVALGVFFSNLMVRVLYGFGELVCDTKRIADRVCGTDASEGEKTESVSESPSPVPDQDTKEKMTALENWKRLGMITEEQYQNELKRIQ